MPQNAGGPFDHHLARDMRGLADQRDAERALLGVRRRAGSLRAHPLGAEPRLAGAAAAEHQPRRPRNAAVAERGRFLMSMRQRDEVVMERHQSVRLDCLEHRPHPGGFP